MRGVGVSHYCWRDAGSCNSAGWFSGSAATPAPLRLASPGQPLSLTGLVIWPQKTVFIVEIYFFIWPMMADSGTWRGAVAAQYFAPNYPRASQINFMMIIIHELAEGGGWIARPAGWSSGLAVITIPPQPQPAAWGFSFAAPSLCSSDQRSYISLSLTLPLEYERPLALNRGPGWLIRWD